MIYWRLQKCGRCGDSKRKISRKALITIEILTEKEIKKIRREREVVAETKLMYDRFFFWDVNSSGDRKHFL